MKKQRIVYLMIVVMVTAFSCKKFLDIPPPDNQLGKDEIFSNDKTAIQAVSGIFEEMMVSGPQFSNGAVTIYAGLASDEIVNYLPGQDDGFATNQLTPESGLLEYNFWMPAYKHIYAANQILASANNNNGLSVSIRKQVIGEASFIRAFCYYYLVNLFGAVPLVTGTDYALNAAVSRTSESEIYSLIKSDLITAMDMLAEAPAPAERERPNKWTAAALLARLQLQLKDWAGAAQTSSSIINAGSFSLVTDLNAVFTVNSPETIWKLQPVIDGLNTWEAVQFIPYPGLAPNYFLRPQLLQVFEPGDLRKAAWVSGTQIGTDSLYYPSKYKIAYGSPISESNIVFRLAEQYLIRAEARLALNNEAGALEDINTVRQRAALAAINISGNAGILQAISQERRIEYFCEWGMRWFDLKRSGIANTVLTPLKPGWSATDTLWPIPANQIHLNQKLIQNQGY